MTFGSLFTGIGGIDLGLEWAGMQCRWQVEIDSFCQRVLVKRLKVLGNSVVPQVAGWVGARIQDLDKVNAIETKKEGNRPIWSDTHLIANLKPHTPE